MGFLIDLAVVAMGGALGAVVRHSLTAALPALPGSKAMIGTIVANVLGCMAIGALGQWVELDASNWSERHLLLVRVGLLGSLTTFSTFTSEAWSLGNDGRMGMLLFHLAAHLVMGFLAFWLGSTIVRELAT